MESQVLSLKYNMDAYMATVLEVTLGTCVESWVKQKVGLKSQHKSHDFFCIINQDPPLMI